MKIGTAQTITTATGTTPIPVASTGVVDTPAFNLNAGEAFGLELLAVSDGAVDVKVELQESMDGTNFVTPDAFPAVAILEDEDRHIVNVEPVPAMYGRFRMTGQGSNHSSTTVQLKLFRQEQT